jgi:poly-gamma-glutamate synthesis protein (capsule biosynthesis protein)
MGRQQARRPVAAGLAGIALLLAGCDAGERDPVLPPAQALPTPTTDAAPAPDPPPAADPGPRGVVTLGFAGDVHFELHLADLLRSPRGALGPITRSLREPDVTMVNLESAIARPGRTPEAKELEVPDERYHFRTSPAALDLLARSGVDVVSVANNHGADFGRAGLGDTLRARRTSPVPVVGVGKDRSSAFAPHRVTVGDTDLAFFAADASFREGASPVWAAGPDSAGVAAARAPRPRFLLRAVREADRRGDVVVVYLHWGAELQGCPTPKQRTAARALAGAGADVVVGTHAHVPLGSGWLGDTYVSYGLGNFVWYHNVQDDSGMLRLTVRDGRVAGHTWVPAGIAPDGLPRPLSGGARRAAVEDWHRLRGCTGLAPRPPS